MQDLQKIIKIPEALKGAIKLAKLLVIDNYDSFTYNLVQYALELGAEVEVIRNDDYVAEAFLDFINQNGFTHILLSPGPGRPCDSVLTKVAITALAGDIPILGICLGHQAIGEVFGADVIKAPYLMHGKTSKISHNNSKLFKDIPSPYTATRYHSLVIDRDSIDTKILNIDAWTEDGLVMGVSHCDKANLFGVQYHPESILSEHGYRLLFNFLSV